MKLTCPHCQKQYQIDPQRIPAGTKALKCAACGQAIPLKSKPASTSVPTGERLSIECPGCGKTYYVPKAKIPPHLKTLTCKACGEAILLKTTRTPAPEPEPRGYDSYDEEENVQEGPPDWLSTYLTKERVRTFAIAFVLFVIVVAFLPAMIRGVGSLGRRVASYARQGVDSLSQEPDQSASTRPKDEGTETVEVAVTPTVADPVFVVRVSPQLVNGLVDVFPSVAPLQPTLQSLEIQSLSFWLLTDANNVLAPGLSLDMDQPTLLHSYLDESGPLAGLFTRLSPVRYQPNETIWGRMPSAETNGPSTLSPVERYCLHVHERGALFVPNWVSDHLEKTPDYLEQCRLNHWLAEVQHEHDLFCCSARFSPQQLQHWQATCSSVGKDVNAAVPSHPLLDLVAENLACLHDVEHLSLAYTITEDLQRCVSYSQTFGPGVDGQSLYDRIETGGIRAKHNSPSLLQLASVACNSPHIQRRLEFFNDTMIMDVNWAPEQDREILPLFKEALVNRVAVLDQGNVASTAALTTSGNSQARPAQAAWETFMATLFRQTLRPEKGSLEYTLARALVQLKTLRSEYLRHYGEDIASLYFVTNRRGELQQLIPYELAVADPINPSRYGYTVEPFQGYHIVPVPSRVYTEQSLQKWRSVSGQRYPWTGTKLKFLTVKDVPNLVATPVDRSLPTFVYDHAQKKVFLHRQCSKKLDYLNKPLTSDDGWLEVDTQVIEAELAVVTTP